MIEQKPVCIINKTEKKISPNGTSYDLKTLIVQGQTMKEVKEVFDEEWN